MWNDLPAPDGETTDSARAGCERIRDFVVEHPQAADPESTTSPPRGSTTAPSRWSSGRTGSSWPIAGGTPGARGSSRPTRLSTQRAEAASALALPQGAEGRRSLRGVVRPVLRHVPRRLRRQGAGAGLPRRQGRQEQHRPAPQRRVPQHDRLLPRRRAVVRADPRRRRPSRAGRPLARVRLHHRRARCASIPATSGSNATETSFLRGPEFDFARAEDKDAASEPQIKRLSEVYLAKARRINAGEAAIRAVADQFEIISASIRSVERDKIAAEPLQVQALQAFARKAYRRPLSDEERRGVTATSTAPSATRTASATRTRSATPSSAS